jgi:DNA-binding response OmpR family regulator
VPVILVTGWGASLDEAEVQEAGVAAVVHKPFEIDDLVRTTTEVLADKGSGAAAEEPQPKAKPA